MIVFTGLIIKMKTSNLITIRCLANHMEVSTEVDNIIDNYNTYTRVKQGNEQQTVLEQHSQIVPIRYDSNQLREIADHIKHQKHYRMLTHSTIINVRRLRLNKRGSRG